MRSVYISAGTPVRLDVVLRDARLNRVSRFGVAAETLTVLWSRGVGEAQTLRLPLAVVDTLPGVLSAWWTPTDVGEHTLVPQTVGDGVPMVAQYYAMPGFDERYAVGERQEGDLSISLGGSDANTSDAFEARVQQLNLASVRKFGFFRPFFGGVYLDRELDTASNFFAFVFQQFAKGEAAVPALGIQQLPEQLASRLPAGTVRLSSPVAAVLDGGRTVQLASGETLRAATTVLATDGPAAAQLLATDLATPATLAARHTTCTYFTTAGAAPSHGRGLLHLNAAPKSLVHNVAFPADISPAVAPSGQGLVSVSTHGEHGLSDDELTARLRT
ncbi:hypothetical protein EON62_02275, partial [archaeon]